MKFLPPRNTPGLPQGDYTFTPAVKTFGPFEVLQDLEDEINLYFSAVVTVDTTININEVKYQAARKANNVISYSAMLYFTVIEIN